MTKVLVRRWRAAHLKERTASVIGGLLVFATASAMVCAQTPADHCPKTAADLYTRLSTIGLDPDRVYHIRGASIHRPSLDLTFDDGTLAFTEDVCGRTTGAFFVGDGEILLQPPNRVERGSLTLFTGMAILEEQYTSGYLRFNDDTAELLQPFLSPVADSADFLKEWSAANRQTLGVRLYPAAHRLQPFSSLQAIRKTTNENFRPSCTRTSSAKSSAHLKFSGTPPSAEPLWAGKPQVKDGIDFFDIWTSFVPPAPSGAAAPAPRVNEVSISSFRIRASVDPPTQLQATADLDIRVRNGGQRTLLFELSRYLKIDSVEAGGHPVDFIQNPAIEGTQLRRKGNDLVAVVFPSDLKSGQELKLSFHYAGDVLSDAGNGLLYVGERGTWYPSFGLSHAHFDMVFHYPPGWTLVATGKQVSRGAPETRAPGEAAGEKISHWVSERPIPVAGFNLGKYLSAEAKAGNIIVEAYAARGVEKAFPKPPAEVIEVPGTPRLPGTKSVAPIVVPAPSAFAGARSPGRGRPRRQSHHNLLAMVWPLPVQHARTDANARRLEPGLARPDLSFERRFSEPAGTTGSSSRSCHA